MEVIAKREELKKIVKEAIKEFIEEEKIENFLKAILPVSKQEMEDIVLLPFLGHFSHQQGKKDGSVNGE